MNSGNGNMVNSKNKFQNKNALQRKKTGLFELKEKALVPGMRK